MEGLYVGCSAAANLCVAAKLLVSGRIKADAAVVTVLCDTGLKYLCQSYLATLIAFTLTSGSIIHY